MHQLTIEPTFTAWRDAARLLLHHDVPPQQIDWHDTRAAPALPLSGLALPLDPPSKPHHRVPPRFLEQAQTVAHHRDPRRWSILYRTLHRLTHGEPQLLSIASDDDVRDLEVMAKAVHRDRHKMTAFVRFKRVERDAEPHYVAWYKPAHYVVPLAAPHFRDRYAAMRWSILTADECVHWDGNDLRFTPGVARDAAPADDELETLWLQYYGSIFNPARIKLGAMRKEMPVRYWPQLPETRIIPDLLQAAPARVAEMVARSQALATEMDMTDVPQTNSIKILREAACACTRCPLYKPATQTVFGEGPDDADVVFVGEQPGDGEDRAGKPFVGPAGRLLDEVLEEVGIDRKRVYVTNAVKHFKFEPRGTRRIHVKPNAREIAACNVWVTKELEIIKPSVLVLLGATAAQALVGRQFRITQQRGEIFESAWSPWTMATFHPSALLRVPDEAARQEMRAHFTADLTQVSKKLRHAG
ncbi:MAG TPA: UdgX family uracil-DNA binding protein [Tepidisphaeraceae bacterium]|jgi:DNA polymerase